MDLQLTYTFRNQTYSAQVYFSFEKDPCYLFVILLDEELIREFTEDVSIKTDCEVVLPTNDAYPELQELRYAIFSAVIQTPEFQRQKQLYKSEVTKSSEPLK